MSVSAIFPSSALNQANNLQNANQQQRTEFQQLTQALQSGNLTRARDAYSSVQQSLQNSNPLAAHHHRPHHGGGGSRILTSGFPSSTVGSDISAASPSDVFQPVVNLTA